MASNKKVKRYQSLRDQVIDILKDELERGRFGDDRLPGVRALAQRFEVSTMTIYGALTKLQEMELVECVPSKGVYPKAPGTRAPVAVRAKHFALLCSQAEVAIAEDTYYAEVWQGLFEGASKLGARLTFVRTQRGKEEQTLRQAAMDMRLDGAVLLAVTHEDIVRRCARLGLPLVLADHHFEHNAIDCVDLDSRQGTRAAVDHLAELGHRQIGLLANPNPERNADRLSGFREGLLAWHIDPERHPMHKGVPNEAGGFKLMKEIVRRAAPLPTAYFVWNGTMAFGAVAAARASGLRVPEDLSFVTCGPRAFLKKYPGITSTVADAAELGRRAIGRLLERIQDPAREAGIEWVPMTLHILGSTAAPRLNLH